jgi:hypothetical protein
VVWDCGAAVLLELTRVAVGFILGLAVGNITLAFYLRWRRRKYGIEAVIRDALRYGKGFARVDPFEVFKR